jgi:hypothetical protein
MNTRSIPLGLMLFAVLCAMAAPAPAQTQTAKPAAHSRPQSSSAAAKAQLAADLAEFKKNPTDTILRDRIIALAKTINPAPVIPEEAQDNFAKAAVAVQAAVTPDNYKAAAQIFEQAAAEAPWYADADYSAASAYAQGKDFDAARRNLTLYMAAVRTGTSTQEAETLRRDIDREQADQQMQQAMQQFMANQSDAGRRQIIQLVQSMKTQPEIPEEARGHFVMAEVLAGESEDNPTFVQRAIEEYKAASLSAPWWGEAYKKLAAMQKTAGRYDDAIASLNLYELTLPADARESTLDDIYRLKVQQRVAADAEAKKQEKEQQKRALEEQQQETRAAIESRKYTVEGRWYPIPMAGNFFVGGEANQSCDYYVSQKGGRWAITNSCAKSAWAIDQIQIIDRQISFHLSGHDPGYPFTLVIVTFTLSDDGQTLVGQESVYNNGTEHLDDHPVRWSRRE